MKSLLTKKHKANKKESLKWTWINILYLVNGDMRNIKLETIDTMIEIIINLNLDLDYMLN